MDPLRETIFFFVTKPTILRENGPMARESVGRPHVLWISKYIYFSESNRVSNSAGRGMPAYGRCTCRRVKAVVTWIREAGRWRRALACGYGSAVRSSVSSRGPRGRRPVLSRPPQYKYQPTVSAARRSSNSNRLHLGGSPYVGPSHLGGSHRACRCAVVHLIDFFLGRRQTTSSRSSQQHGRRTGKAGRARSSRDLQERELPGQVGQPDRTCRLAETRFWNKVDRGRAGRQGHQLASR